MVLETAFILSLINDCQTDIDSKIIQRLINIESSGNPYAIAVKGVPIVKQPATKEEAIQSAKQLDNLGLNYSVGLMQVNYSNFSYTGLTIETAFNYCANIKAGSTIFKDCFDRASLKFKDDSNKTILDKAASCYYSGNFDYGFKKEGKHNVSYVDKFNNVIPIKSSVKKTTIENKPKPKNNIEVWDVFKDFTY
jgi:type IV secretion system protein VirB1